METDIKINETVTKTEIIQKTIIVEIDKIKLFEELKDDSFESEWGTQKRMEEWLNRRLNQTGLKIIDVIHKDDETIIFSEKLEQFQKKSLLRS